ncbi:MAG: 50S ribosomal protein L4 [Acidimicrobiales bacterium]
MSERSDRISVDVKDMKGKGAGSVDLDDEIFGIRPNVLVMHQVVTAQLAARRTGGQSTKTRAEVAGGGAKPWRQKGTGRSRQGSIRSPQWRGGGVALGPKPRNHAQRTPKKMVRLALRSALSDRAADGRVVVVDGWTFEAPKTKDAVAALGALELEGRLLVVLSEDDDNAWRSFRNLPDVHPILARELNAYDVLVSDYVVFTRETLPSTSPEPPPSHVRGPEVKPSRRSRPAAPEGPTGEEGPGVKPSRRSRPAAPEGPEAEAGASPQGERRPESTGEEGTADA